MNHINTYLHKDIMGHNYKVRKWITNNFVFKIFYTDLEKDTHSFETISTKLFFFESQQSRVLGHVVQ